MEKSFARDIGALDDLFSFLDGFINKHQLNSSIAYAVKLVVEELFVNMVRYHSDNPNPVSVSLKKENSKLKMLLVDFNVDPFDITKTEEFDPNMPLEKRRAGGMGIHLVKTVMDDVQYEYNEQERTSIIRLTKNI